MCVTAYAEDGDDEYTHKKGYLPIKIGHKKAV